MRLPDIVLIALLVLAACTGVRPLPAPPAANHARAALAGYPGARDWGNAPALDRADRIRVFVSQIRDRARRTGGMPTGGRLDSLVLSGGGSDGPFGAGLLVGWTARGDRPEFTVVTGISAGALIAPFAFLGPRYDDALRAFTAEGSTDSLVSFRIIAGLLDGIGLIDNSKLQRTLRGLITPELVREITIEYDKGRRLLIGTTNLDAQRPVYWHIDRIAKEGLDRPVETADLITKIMIASASIPGAFPPQFFTVELDGRRYSEMHVDGGVTNQLFYLPADGSGYERLPPDIRRFAERGTLYVLRNTKLDPEYAPVTPGLVQIAGRSISTLIKFSGRNDVLLLADRARTAGIRLKTVAVPESFEMEETELFDPAYMRALFALGYDLALNGEPWRFISGPADAPAMASARPAGDRPRP